MKATTPYLGIAAVVAGGLSLISAQALARPAERLRGCQYVLEPQ